MTVTEAAPGLEVRRIRRTLGLGSLVFIMFFTVSGGAYGLEDTIGQSGAGMGLLLIVLTPLLWSAPTALIVAELATALPEQGGYYYWVKRGLGEFWGFQEGWWSWVTSWVDMAIYPVLFVDYAAYFAPSALGPGHALNRWLLGLAMIWTFTAVNVAGAKLVGDSSRLFGYVVIAPFALLVLFALPKLHVNPIRPFVAEGQPLTHAFGIGLFVVMWNYLGWDGVSTVAGEMKDPQRNYPRMLLITVPLITAVYLLPTIAGLAALGTDPAAWAAGTFTNVAEAVAGSWLGRLLAAAALVSASGLFSSLLLSISRLPFAMAADGYLPRRLMALHPRYGTPWLSIVVSSGIYSIFILGPFQRLVVVDVTVYAAALSLEFAALIALRIKEPDLHRPFKIPGGWPVIALLSCLPGAVICLAVYYQTVLEGWRGSIGLAAVALASGPLLYPFAARHRHRHRHGRHEPQPPQPDHDVERSAP